MPNHDPAQEIVTRLLAARGALDQVIRALVSGRVARCLATPPPEAARTAVARAVGLHLQA